MPIAVHAHHARMPSFWKKAIDKQLNLSGVEPRPPAPARTDKPTRSSGREDGKTSVTPTPPGSAANTANIVTANPLMVPVTSLCEDPNNPRTEFPDAELDELAQSIRQHGILQAIVVHPADVQGRYRIHFGAKRFRAAVRAGLQNVPVTLRDAAPDPYAQVAENLKRHSLSPLDLARFIRRQVDAGDSNATVASKLNLDLTTVAHHLTLLSLPPVLDEALKSGRCTSPRTLHELHRLHAQNPEQVQTLLAGNGDLTRKAIAAVKATAAPFDRHADQNGRASVPLMAQAGPLCDRLQTILERATRPGTATPTDQLTALHSRLVTLSELSAPR
jgi:ParB family transcriptional regulator, chromosome partitioning protein